MRIAARLTAAALVLVFLLSGVAGSLSGQGILHPQRRELTPQLIAEADASLARLGAMREDFTVQAPDEATLRGWKVRPPEPNGDWVLLFHGVSDNRMGVLGHAEVLLRHGYSVVMMDARAHGASDGDMATYGWKERWDTHAIADALYASESVRHLYALGESMGAAIALQSAAVEPHILGVIAESPFSDLREASYDYAGLHMSHWLGRTLLRPAAMMGVSGMEKEGGFSADEVSPEKAVASRPFAVLLICGTKDKTLPARHARRIYKAATGPKQLWLVKGACHTCALGTAPKEFEQRVVDFFAGLGASKTEEPAKN